jgi:putative GTP pyrophosphokinase
VSQRLKRMPTIIDKLRREPTMQPTTMQDIGGVRAVLRDVGEVNKLVLQYRDSRFKHELCSEDDYITKPKQSGYRGVHLIYKYNNDRNNSYDGLLLELQIRTKLEHSWATAVEVMGTFTGEALKSSQGSKEWLNFFALTSSAFAFLENRPRVPGFERMSKPETFEAVKQTEKALDVKRKMIALPVAVEKIITTRTHRPQTSHYHLIILDSQNKKVFLESFGRDYLTDATAAYAKYEERAAKGEKIEPVLVSATQLNRAYPNFFLNAQEFLKNLNRVIPV